MSIGVVDTKTAKTLSKNIQPHREDFLDAECAVCRPITAPTRIIATIRTTEYRPVGPDAITTPNSVLTTRVPVVSE